MSCSPRARRVGRGLELVDELQDAGVELAAHAVASVVGHVVDDGPQPIEQPLEDAVLHGSGQPPRRLVPEAVLQLGPVLVEVAVEALQPGVDDLVVPSLAGEGAEGPARHRDDRGRFDPLAQDPLQHVVDGVVLEEVDHLDGARQHVTGQLVGVGGDGHPRGDPAPDTGGPYPLGHGVGREEAVLDELAQRLPELRLALDDDRGVGDGEAQRVTEQRHHGEPVSQATHHRRLGAGLDVAERGPALGPGHHGGDEHSRRGGEEGGGAPSGGDELVPLARRARRRRQRRW